MLISQLPDWEANKDRERGTLLIVDRSMDPIAPLMHEYTYQAMVNDLVHVKGEVALYVVFFSVHFFLYAAESCCAHCLMVCLCVL